MAAVGGLLVLGDPHMEPHPLLGLAGWLIIASTGGFGAPSDHWLALEESAGCVGGVLLVTLGPGRVTAVTLLWLACVGVGVLARGGRVGAVGRVIIVAVLASPMIRWGVSDDRVSLLVAGSGLLLAVGRASVEISDLLRDPLTGAVSRAALDGEIARLLARADAHLPAGMIMIDLDNFGAVNKREGYAAGDALLVRTVDVITAALGDGDVLGRLGGDEFAVITLGTSPTKLAERIVRGLTDAGIGASAGVAEAPFAGMAATEVKSIADLALRHAKQAGKGRFSVRSPSSDVVGGGAEPPPRARRRPPFQRWQDNAALARRGFTGADADPRAAVTHRD